MSARRLPSSKPGVQGQRLVGGEPVILHCNHYNYWLQKTVLLVEGLGMESVCVEAGACVTHAALTRAAREMGLSEPQEILKLASEFFAESGFGLVDFGGVGAEGGMVTLPVSHYGQMFFAAANTDRFDVAQNHFDQGYVCGALAAAYGKPWDTFEARLEECHSLGAEQGKIAVSSRTTKAQNVKGGGAGSGDGDSAPPPPSETSVNEAGILEAVSGLDFSGNEEGLVPRFGVMLTNHFANYYNEISYQFVRRMRARGTLGAAEMLLVDAGHHCAFNTFGGIMTSPEWDAVVRPQCKTNEDWVHGMTAIVNALGWGVWRVQEVSRAKIVMRLYDDYESRGYASMYGKVDRPVSYLATGGVAGMMNLIYVGSIAKKPELNYGYYKETFNAPDSYTACQTKNLAAGDPYTEVVAEPAG